MPVSETIHRARVKALLVDVGGTIWPDDWADPDEVEAVRARQLREGLGIPPALADALSAQLQERVVKQVIESRRVGSLAQDSDEVARNVLARFGIEPTPDAVQAVRDAMYVSPIGQFEPFPGAEGLLATATGLGLACVVVSNTSWRRGEDYERDFAEFGLARYVRGYITSADVGYRKPHRAMFESAARVAGCAPRECVMLGNSEEKDVRPARELGMRAIRVGHEPAAAVDPTADAVVRSLAEATVVLAAWATCSAPPT